MAALVEQLFEILAFRYDGCQFRHIALTDAPPQLIDDLVLQDGEHPGFRRRRSGEFICTGQRGEQRILYCVFCLSVRTQLQPSEA
jgi:hypothetical protein